MSTKSKIEWCTATWNPVLGCAKVSPGCDHCYAITQARIRESNPNPKVAAAFAGLTERNEDGVDWTGKINLLPERLKQPTTWRKPQRVFVNSLADLFHADVPDIFIAQVFAVMAVTPQHVYQCLTKRHARLRSLLSSPKFADDVWALAWQVDGHGARRRHWPLRNVWVGVSVEDQQWADIRIPALLDTPAAVRFLSCEPLLGPVDLAGPVDRFGGRPRLTYWLTGKPDWAPAEATRSGLLLEDIQVGPRINWVIAGGESGPGARPMHPAWPRLIRDQCLAAGVPYFFKQWGQFGELAPLDGQGRFDYRRSVTVANDGTVYRDGELAYPDGPRRGDAIRARHDHAQLHIMHRVGKHAAGRELDGRTWDEYPEGLAS